MNHFKYLFLLIFFLSSGLAFAAEVAPDETISRATLDSIKIVSSRFDKISLFLKNNLKKNYRIADLSEKQVTNILNKLGDDQVIQIQSVPVKGQNYLEVTSWQ